MKEITAGLRKTQWRRKVRIRGGRGPAGRRESGAGGGGAGIQEPGGAVLSVPARSQGGRSRGPDSERGKDGEAGPRRGAPGEGQGNARVREGGPSEFPDAPCPAQPSPGPDGEQSVAIASPAQPLGQRARVRSGPRTSHPVPGRHPTQGPGVGWRPSGPALPGAARAAGGSRAHGREVAASASALRLVVKTGWTPSRQHPSQKDGWFPRASGRPRGPHSALYFPRPCAIAREQRAQRGHATRPRPRGRRGVCPDTERWRGPGSPMASYLRLWPEGQARG